jgi:hypothetical protein
MTGLPFIKYRLALRLNGSVDITGASDVPVQWVDTAGGTLDVSTGAVVGGVQTPASGVIRALVAEEPARSVLRHYAEVQAGDLWLTVNAGGLVTLPDSSTRSLDTIATPRFIWAGRWYAPKEVGEQLAYAMTAAANQNLYRRLLLRRAT